MLTADEIYTQVKLGRIEIDPWTPELVNPNSVDVRLAPKLLRIKDATLDFKQPYETEPVYLQSGCGTLLQPGELYLGSTVERTNTPHHIPEYSGKSTTGRYFLFSHVTAGFGDLGFNGHWTLEIVCMRAIRVYPYMRIGQICFQEATGRVLDELRYKGRYAGSREPMAGVAGNVLPRPPMPVLAPNTRG